MAAEDLTTWTEDDTPGRLTVTSAKAEFNDLDQNETSQITHDHGAGALGDGQGDFDHDYEYIVDSTCSGTGYMGLYAVGKLATDKDGHYDALSYCIVATTRTASGTNGGDVWLSMVEASSKTSEFDNSMDDDTLYYARLWFVDADGSYGTYYWRTWSDSARTTPVSAQISRAPTSSWTVRFSIIAGDNDDGAGGVASDFDVQNVEFQEPAPTEDDLMALMVM